LKEYETGRRFGKCLWVGHIALEIVGRVHVVIGGHKNNEEEKQKMLAAQMVAIERAQMRIRQQRK